MQPGAHALQQETLPQGGAQAPQQERALLVTTRENPQQRRPSRAKEKIEHFDNEVTGRNFRVGKTNRMCGQETI